MISLYLFLKGSHCQNSFLKTLASIIEQNSEDHSYGYAHQNICPILLARVSRNSIPFVRDTNWRKASKNKHCRLVLRDEAQRDISIIVVGLRKLSTKLQKSFSEEWK